MKKTRYRQWIRRVLLVTLMLFALIPAAGWFLLGRPVIQNRIVHALNRRFSEIGPYPVRIEDLRGRPPLHLTLARISLSDRHGVWMRIEEARARVDGRSLLAGRLRIRELSAGTATVFRWPVPPEGERPAPVRTAGMHDIPAHITLDRLSVPRVRLEAGLPGLPGDESVEFELLGRAHASPADGFSAWLDLQQRDAAVTRLLSRVQWAGPGAPIRLWADIEEPEGGWLGSALGRPLAGRFRVEADATVRPGFAHGDLVFRSETLGRGRMDWRAENRDGWEIDADVQTRDLAVGPLRLHIPRLTLRARFGQDAGQLSFEGAMRSGSDVVTARGELYRNPAGIGLRDLHIASGPSILHGALFRHVDDGFVEGRLDFAEVYPGDWPFMEAWIPAEQATAWGIAGTATGFAKAWVEDARQRVRASVEARAPAGAGLRARALHIEAEAVGPWSEPEAHVRIGIQHVEAEPVEHFWPTDFARADLTISLIRSRLAAEADVEADGFRAQAKISTDGVLDALRARGTDWADHPGEGSLRIEARLDALPEQAVPSVEHLRGTLRLSLDGRGTVREPELAGRIEWAHGRLTITELGARLADIRIVVAGANNRLHIEEAAATDGERGRLTARGTIHIPSLHAPPRIELDIESDSMRLFDRPIATARVSGEISLRPAEDDRHLLLGHLGTREASIRLPARLPPHVPDIRIVERGAPPPEPPAEDRMAAWLAGVDLDVGVRVRRMSVRGRGLDSEWSGLLQTEGTLASPRLVGTIEAGRGRVHFLGRRFSIEEAALNWSGPVRTPPSILFRATTRSGGMRAWIDVHGPADAPTITLHSDPPGPEDEVLARVLFGRSMDRLSPFQAIRLAHGLRVLQGGGDTWDLMARGQQILQVDQIDIVHDEEEEGVGAVSVGKQVGSMLYLEGAKGLGGARDRLTADIELSPSFTLETEASPGLREGVRLRWSRDY